MLSKGTIFNEEKPVTYDAAAALLNHMKTFADEEGYISAESVTKAFREKFGERFAGDTEKFGIITMQVAALRGIAGVTKKCSLAPAAFPFFYFGEGKFRPEDALGKFNHPHDTGFYDKKGKFQEELFNQAFYDPTDHPDRLPPTDKILVNRDPMDPTVEIIFESKIKLYMKTNCQDKKDPRWNDESWFYQLVGKQGNIGEFDILMRSKATTIERLNCEGDLERCIRKEDLRAFYINSPQMLSSNVNGVRPDPIKQSLTLK